jgi:hypothetical protein
MSTSSERRLAELDAKLGLLREELAFWLQLAEPDGVLERHHGQLHRLGQMLGSALDRLDLQRYASEAHTETMEQLLAVHHVWNFYRSKLALRLVVRFEPALVAADELARACVRPLYDAAVSAGRLAPWQVREPPLAFFDSSGTTFAQQRGQAYRGLLPGGVPDGLVRQLPVPVIAVPWYQQGHLPEIAVVAHEAAHLVDDDLGLSAALRPLLDGRMTANLRSADWARWFPEVLADVLATLWLGPAYGQALADLAGSTEDRGYPPADLRLRVVAATLDLLGHAGGPVGAVGSTLALYLLDVAEVVSVILSEPLEVFGYTSLRRLAPFTATHQAEAAADVERLRVWIAPQSQDPRLLVAAGIQAFADDPDGFVRTGTAALVYARIASVPGARAAMVPHESEARDRRLGADLLRWVS